ncbi:MAG: tryptophan--tRNA ligase [Saprospiraceae bacterium]|nr:tryptophan--tRNA ligase [Saprospiraceae bacterium]
MKRVLSCIQPTGDLHLGNYFGAVQNWVNLQQKYSCIYGVVDNHAMTAPYKAADLRDNTWKMAFQLLACGIETKNLFIQSLVPEHTELSWILSCTTSYGELQKMTQFKDKVKQLEDKDNQAFISTGLFMYPVLQAADILIYRADYVPVGKDQEQHLELSRNIAARFNHQFGKDYFVHPEPLFTEIPKLLSPADPTKKMSKSLGEKHYINLFGDANKIKKQIKSAVTDVGTEGADKMSAGVENLFNLLKACGKMNEHADFMAQYNEGIRRYGDLKAAVAEALVELTQPFGERLNDLNSRRNAVIEEVKDSSSEVRKIAQETLREVKDIVGILNPE